MVPATAGGTTRSPASTICLVEVDGMPAKQAYGIVENSGRTGTTWLTLVITDSIDLTP